MVISPSSLCLDPCEYFAAYARSRAEPLEGGDIERDLTRIGPAQQVEAWKDQTRGSRVRGGGGVCSWRKKFLSSGVGVCNH